MKKTNCIKCGIEFNFARTQGLPDAKYCSRKCFAHKKEKGICIFCGKDFLFWITTRPTAIYCSRICQNTKQAQDRQKKYKEEISKLTHEERLNLLRIAFEKHEIEKTDICWIWRGRRRKGYGQMHFLGQNIPAHRASYLIYKGEIGFFYVMHKCDNPPCVNPDHLVLGTALDNNRDRIAKGRSNNAMGEKFGRSPLTSENVKEIKRLLDIGVTSVRIAKDFNVSKMTISDIKLGKTWKHIT